jgi:hypothetical protein
LDLLVRATLFVVHVVAFSQTWSSLVRKVPVLPFSFEQINVFPLLSADVPAGTVAGLHGPGHDSGAAKAADALTTSIPTSRATTVNKITMRLIEATPFKYRAGLVSPALS